MRDCIINHDCKTSCGLIWDLIFFLGCITSNLLVLELPHFHALCFLVFLWSTDTVVFPKLNKPPPPLSNKPPVSNGLEIIKPPPPAPGGLNKELTVYFHKAKTCLCIDQLNSENSGSVLFLRLCFVCLYGRMGKDGYELTLETIGPISSSFKAMLASEPAKITKNVITVNGAP